MAFTLPFIHVNETKMKNWKKKVLAKKPKGEWSSHVTRKRSVSKYRNRKTGKLLWAMMQKTKNRMKRIKITKNTKKKKTKNKNNWDKDSYMRCVTQQNCKGLMAM